MNGSQQPDLVVGTDRIAAWSPEIELLLCCARTHLEALQVERIRHLLARDLDWESLTHIAFRQGVAPLLYRSLNSLSAEVVPEAIMARLRHALFACARRSLFLVGELLSLLKLFAAHDLPAVPFKGPVLATYAYGDLALRPFGDLDILVHKQDVARARRLLLAHGYRQLKPGLLLTDAQEAAYLERTHEYQFGRSDKAESVLVEIQWGFAARSFVFSLDAESVWQRLGAVAIGGRSIPRLSPEDELLILCVDGTKMCWRKALRRVCDIAELIRACPGLDWEGVVQQANALGSRRILLLGLFLAHDLLDAPLPETLRRQVREDAVVKRLAARVYGQLFAEGDGTLEALEDQLFSVFHLKTRERLRDKVRYCFRAAAPSAKDWEYFPLPPILSALYYLIRPIRLARQLVGPLLK